MKTHPNLSRRVFVACLGLGLLGSARLARADDDDHERAYRERDRGDIKALRDILDGLQRELPPGSEVIAVELEHEDGVWVYEFRIIDETGRRREVCVDAKTGRLLREENGDHACSSGRGRSPDRRGRSPRPLGGRIHRGDHD
ncbi:MAG: PepSY domain-containing protein [Hyphomicrobiales bacterium]|nr:PepSY domain-containing protein [Hyphomicrobiales bacterium]